MGSALCRARSHVLLRFLASFPVVEMVLPFIAPMIGYGGIMAAKAYRNSEATAPGEELRAQTTRDNSVVDRLLAGSTPPVGHWSEKHLEKMLKTNSALQLRAEELRSARNSAVVSRASSKESVLSAELPS